MIEVEESKLMFKFDWDCVIKYDEKNSFHTKTFQSFSGTKGIDFIGYKGNDVFLIEVKDYRSANTEDREEEEYPVKDNIINLIDEYAKENIKLSKLKQAVKKEIRNFKTKGTIQNEFEKKMKDSLLGLIYGARINHNHTNDFKNVVSRINSSDTKLNFIFWIEKASDESDDDEKKTSINRINNELGNMEKELQRKFKLSSKEDVSICSLNRSPNSKLFKRFSFEVTDKR